MEYFKNIKPKLICIVEDEAIGLKGYLVIDSFINHSSCGGIRMHENISIDEVKGLARGMTLKYGFNNMNQGGAKAGIVTNINVPLEKKQLLLKRFAEIIKPYIKSGFYHPGPDMLVTQNDIYKMLEYIDIKVQKQRKNKGYFSGYHTALSVMVSIEAACEFLKINLENSTIAIEGFGSVGSNLALLLFNRNVKIISISTSIGALYDDKGLNIPELYDLNKKYGHKCVEMYDKAKKIKKEQLLELNVNILSQCAIPNTISSSNVHNIKAQIICPGANDPITKEAESYLHQAGKIVVPDFVSNSGGVIGNKIEVTGVEKKYIENFLRDIIKERLIEILRISALTNKLPSFYAEKYSLQQSQILKDNNTKIGIKSTIYKIAYTIFMSGIIPNFILKSLAPSYFNYSLKKKIATNWKKYIDMVQNNCI